MGRLTEIKDFGNKSPYRRYYWFKKIGNYTVSDIFMTDDSEYGRKLMTIVNKHNNGVDIKCRVFKSKACIGIPDNCITWFYLRDVSIMVALHDTCMYLNGNISFAANRTLPDNMVVSGIDINPFIDELQIDFYIE